MKVAISLSDDLFDRAEAAADRLGLNRSQLYARALEGFLEACGDDPVVRRLDELAEAGVAGVGAAGGRALIDAGVWEW
jgi:predicted transcriptional regulator